MRLRDRLGLSEARQRQAAYLMELGLVGIVFVGLDRGNTGIVVNAGIALAITQLPPLLERDYGFTMDPALVLWITSAVFLHAVGTLGPYRNIWWWDHLTHALSSSLVAGVGYAFVRAIDEHVPDVRFPPTFTFAYILLVVLAFGVLWELLEFFIAGVGSLAGVGTVLTQYGLQDTMLDLVFNTLGGVVVAVWGTAYLTDVSGVIARQLGIETGGSRRRDRD
jgi:hypothetical protein